MPGTMRPVEAAGPFELKVELSREVDGRWIADIAALPGVTVYGRTRKQALIAVEALAVRVIADRIEHGEAGLDGTAVNLWNIRFLRINQMGSNSEELQ